MIDFKEDLPSDLNIGFALVVLLLGIIIGIVAILLIIRSKGTLRGKGFATFTCVGGSLLIFFFALAFPGYKRMQLRAKEAIVKTVARSLKASIEDYKAKHNGERPRSVRDVEVCLPDFVTKDVYFKENIKNPKKFVKDMRNPFNPHQKYTLSGGGLLDGSPCHNGEIGYIVPDNVEEPYRITTIMTDRGVQYTPIELIEE